MLNRFIDQAISRARTRAILLTSLAVFPLGMLAGWSARTVTMRDRVEDAYIRAYGAKANLMNTQAERIIQDGRDKMRRGK